MHCVLARMWNARGAFTLWGRVHAALCPALLMRPYTRLPSRAYKGTATPIYSTRKEARTQQMAASTTRRAWRRAGGRDGGRYEMSCGSLCLPRAEGEIRLCVCVPVCVACDTDPHAPLSSPRVI
jgi:hypothetical protein